MSVCKVVSTELTESPQRIYNINFWFNCTFRYLDISDTRVQHQPGVYKKYYGKDNETEVPASPDVFTYKAVIRFLRDRAAKIKELSLEDTCLSESVLQDIAAIPNLQLLMLNISR